MLARVEILDEILAVKRDEVTVLHQPSTRDRIQKAALVTHIRRTYYSDQGRPVETADIIVPAAHCEIVYEIPINP